MLGEQAEDSYQSVQGDICSVSATVSDRLTHVCLKDSYNSPTVPETYSIEHHPGFLETIPSKQRCRFARVMNRREVVSQF
jgi:hypothetical protein